MDILAITVSPVTPPDIEVVVETPSPPAVAVSVGTGEGLTEAQARVIARAEAAEIAADTVRRALDDDHTNDPAGLDSRDTILLFENGLI